MKREDFYESEKLVSVMLVSAMALSMGACGNSGSSAADTSSNGNSTTNESASSTEAGKETAGSDDKLVVWTLSNDLIDYGKRFEEQTGVAVDTVVIEPANYPTKYRPHYLVVRQSRISSLVSQRC